VSADRELVAGNCWAFGQGDCVGPVAWRTYPLDGPGTSYAMCVAHWEEYGPDGPSAFVDEPDDDECVELWWAYGELGPFNLAGPDGKCLDQVDTEPVTVASAVAAARRLPIPERFNWLAHDREQRRR
jgi:hypothetical protein